MQFKLRKSQNACTLCTFKCAYDMGPVPAGHSCATANHSVSKGLWSSPTVHGHHHLSNLQGSRAQPGVTKLAFACKNIWRRSGPFADSKQHVSFSQSFGSPWRFSLRRWLQTAANSIPSAPFFSKLGCKGLSSSPPTLQPGGIFLNQWVKIMQHFADLLATTRGVFFAAIDFRTNNNILTKAVNLDVV